VFRFSLSLSLSLEEEKDLLGSISALKSAVTVLSKHNSLLQMPRSHAAGIAASVQNVMQKHSSLLAGVLTHSERKAVSAFIQAPEDAAHCLGGHSDLFTIPSLSRISWNVTRMEITDTPVTRA
jgi:hypothetical protein